MPPARHFLLLPLAGAVVLLLGTGLAGTGARAQDSPFIPEGFGGAAAPAAPASTLDRFEFRGVLTIGTDTFVTLVDTTTSRAISLALGDTVDGVRVSEFHPDDGSVQIESGGQSKRVKLREAKIVAMAVPPPPPMTAPGAVSMPPGPQPGGAPAVAGAPISDEEARVRMQRVAEEIRRRREMRRQMLESQQQQPRPATQ